MIETTSPAVMAEPTTQPMALVRPLANPAELMRFHDDVTQIIQGALVIDLDYGVIPGTGSKPSLWKPGAEKLNMAFGVTPTYEIMTQEVDHDRIVLWHKRKKKWVNNKPVFETETGETVGLYRYVIRCKLMRADRFMGEGLGSCSTMESKYIDRPRDCENTALKMAKKRAYVDATLNAYALSNRFTQDVEDIKQNQEAAEVRHSAANAAAASAARHDDVPPPPEAQIHDDVPPPPEAQVAGGGPRSYDPDDSRHAVAMERELEGLQVPKEHWAALSNRMIGRPFRLSMIKEVVAKYRALPT